MRYARTKNSPKFKLFFTNPLLAYPLFVQIMKTNLCKLQARCDELSTVSSVVMKPFDFKVIGSRSKFECASV